MKVYTVVLKSNVHADVFESVYGVYCTKKKAESIMDYVYGMGQNCEMVITELEGE